MATVFVEEEHQSRQMGFEFSDECDVRDEQTYEPTEFYRTPEYL